MNFLQYNPNEVVGNDIELVFPNNPIPADHPYCLSGGAIGWTINGVAIYNPFALREVTDGLSIMDWKSIVLGSMSISHTFKGHCSPASNVVILASTTPSGPVPVAPGTPRFRVRIDRNIEEYVFPLCSVSCPLLPFQHLTILGFRHSDFSLVYKVYNTSWNLHTSLKWKKSLLDQGLISLMVIIQRNEWIEPSS